MNIAFSVILTFLVFLPGIIFRRSYLSSSFSKNFIKTDYQSELLYSFIPSIILLWLFPTVHFLQNINLDIEKIGLCIMGEDYIEKIPEIISKNLDYIICVNIVLWAISFSLGHLSRIFVTYFGFDIIIDSLTFPNKWEYIFSGQLKLQEEIARIKSTDYMHLLPNKFQRFTFLNFFLITSRLVKFVVLREKRKELNDFDGLYVKVLCKQNLIYDGFLVDYFLDSECTLDSIILKYPTYFILNGKKEEPTEIPGNDYVIIKNSEILHVATSAWDLDDIPEAKPLFENVK